MKKILCLLLAVVLTLTVCGALTAAAANETEILPLDDAGEADGSLAHMLVCLDNGEFRNGTITAGNNVKTVISGDVVKFGFKDGFDPMIHIKLNEGVDTGEYPILALKVQRTGTETKGEVFYDVLGGGASAGKEVILYWQETSEWQWIYVDLSGCGSVGYMRFDVFDTASIDTTGMIAGLAFFKTVEDAETFAQSDAGLALGSHPGEEAIEQEIIKEKESQYPLYDDTKPISTGWWFNPYEAGKQISVLFEAVNWFDKMWVFYYAGTTSTPILVTLYDDYDDEVFSNTIYVSGNTEQTVNFGKAIKPGYYTVTFETLEDVEGSHFVLGSGAEREDEIDVEVSFIGALTNGNTQGAPAIKLIKCDPDPNYTEKPTAEPVVTNAPTPVPTPVPTAVPAATEAPTEAAAAATATPPATDSDGSNKVWPIIGIAGGVVLVAAVVIAIAVSKSKKNKK